MVLIIVIFMILVNEFILGESENDVKGRIGQLRG
jgi:hypothetical protein